MSESKLPKGPDFSQGVRISELTKTITRGRVGDQAAILIRKGPETFVLGAICSHYHAHLANGLLDGHEIHCPWHHACFDIRTGEALRAPAFSPIPSWVVEEADGIVYARDKQPQSRRPLKQPAPRDLDAIVIVGGGAAGFAAADQLRRRDFKGSVTVLSDEGELPIDRPNLSKEFLAGTAPEEWVPMRSESFYQKRGIDVRVGKRVVELDVEAHSLTLEGGEKIPYGRLLLATGAEANRLSLPAAGDLPIHTLRSMSDARAIISRAGDSRRAVVVGASFIGLEVAAALRQRGLEVHVVAPDRKPLERVLGPQLGDFIRTLHESHGVVFHLEQTVASVEGKSVRLKNGETIPADLVVAGVGVHPRVDLAQGAGLAIDRGVLVDRHFRTSHPHVFAAGDIARWPDARTGDPIRVEHWVVAERQGQVAALNMLGESTEYADAPFFWSAHYDVQINYVGHAEGFDEIVVDGDIDARNCTVRYKKQGQLRAAASIGRDVENLRIELELERIGNPA